MRLHKLDKIAVRVCGSADKFLSGLTSNSLEKPHNAFLNQYGRIIATFDQVKSGPDEFILIVAASAWGPLKTHADKYARLNKTTLEPLALNVYFDLDANAPLESGDLIVPQNKGRLIVTLRDLPAGVSAGEFTLFRLEYQLPEQGIDYTDEMVLNVHEHDFVSYTKGCFLGQEPVAKVHNRSKPTWKLAVKYQDEVPAEGQQKMTSVVTDPKNGRRKGFIFVANH